MNKFGPPTRQRLKKDKMPLVLMATGLLTLIVFLLVLFPKDQDAPREGPPPETTLERLSQMEERLDAIEERMNLEPASTEARGHGTIEKFAEQIRGVEESVSSKMDRMAKRLDTLERKITTAKSASAPRKPAAKVPEKKRKPEIKKPSEIGKPPQPRPNALYHVVRQGETLYQISRIYGMEVKDLLRLNGIASGSPIHPGQKLVVK